jgi:isoleucyl-tRNA synthetase
MDKNGVKFSKKLQNYKSVNDLLENYGIDAVRLYFLNSPAARGINFKFNEDEIRNYAKDIIIPLQNIVELFCEYSKYNRNNKNYILSDLNKYILNTYNLFKNTVIQEVNKYDVTNIVRYLSKFVFDFSTTYCIFNKDEIKTSFLAVSVIGYILKDLNETILKHITPILYSRFCERLKDFDCLRFKEENYIYTFDIENTIEIIHKILAFRTASNIPLKRYLNRVLIANIPNLDLKLIQKVGYILNEVTFESGIFLKAEYKPLYKEIGRDFGKDTKQIVNSILKGEIESIDKKYFEVVSILPVKAGYETVDNSLYIDVSSTVEIENFYTAKLLTTEIQTLRKKCGLKVYDTVILYIKFENDCLYDIFKSEPITAYVKDILKTENITFCKQNEKLSDPLLDINSSLDCTMKMIKLKEKSVKIELFF